MKNKKIIYIGLGLSALLIIAIILIVRINKKSDDLKDHTDFEPISLVENLKNKYPDKKYLKINGEVLNENTNFRNYAFVSDNKIYIYDSKKLDDGQFVYKNIYDSDIDIMNIFPDFGADIRFVDYNDTLYTLHDENIDNKVEDNYNMYLNANYKLSDYLKWEYSSHFLGKKIDYDFMSNYVYVKDNILYRLLYTNDSKYPEISKITGNYEGEKVIRIYNERILKTDKGFYEIMSYFDTKENKTVTTTVKINLLTKYYGEVLTFTYKYVILKDYTIIPINDVMENRVRDYSYDYFLSGFNYMSEVRYEE